MASPIAYNGEAYFADTIFMLGDDQKALADNYAQNLSLFLGDGMFQGIFTDDAVNGIPSLGTSASPTEPQRWCTSISSMKQICTSPIPFSNTGSWRF